MEGSGHTVLRHGLGKAEHAIECPRDGNRVDEEERQAWSRSPKALDIAGARTAERLLDQLG